MDALDREKLLGDTYHSWLKAICYRAGTIIAEVPETRAIVHKCMVPPDVEGTWSVWYLMERYINDETLVMIELFNGEEENSR